MKVYKSISKKLTDVDYDIVDTRDEVDEPVYRVEISSGKVNRLFVILLGFEIAAIIFAISVLIKVVQSVFE